MGVFAWGRAHPTWTATSVPQVVCAPELIWSCKSSLGPLIWSLQVFPEPSVLEPRWQIKRVAILFCFSEHQAWRWRNGAWVDVRHKGSQEPAALIAGATASFRGTWPEKKLQVPNTQLHEAVQILLAQQEGSHGFCDFPRPSRMTTLEKEIIFLYWSKTVEWYLLDFPSWMNTVDQKMPDFTIS